MKSAATAFAALFVGLVATDPAHGTELSQLKILYVGMERSSAYVEFLKGKAALVEAKDRSQFQASDAKSFDVVLFDWPQGEETREMRKLKSPLGARDEWKTPTVLLGSAGLNLAVAWKLKGGSGCTCLDPLAYDLRDHEIFDRPFPINRGQMITIPTPADFRDEILAKEIEVLPLVDDRKKIWRAGWCTHALDFGRYPDVEFFCGGVNSQTPTSAGLWRQGNLLHFGFEQSPAEMNETGKQLLLNSIVYISRFSEDRPIAITPSVFAGPVARSRATAAKWLRNNKYPIEFVKDLVAPGVWKELSVMQPDRGEMADWVDRHARFLHPDSSQLLTIDEDLVVLGIGFDQAEFFDRVLTDLHSKDKDVVARALRLLERYVPTGPADATADQWDGWWKENKPFAFASDAGDYRWYVDPLARRRNVPCAELRGSRRANQ